MCIIDKQNKFIIYINGWCSIFSGFEMMWNLVSVSRSVFRQQNNMDRDNLVVET